MEMVWASSDVRRQHTTARLRQDMMNNKDPEEAFRDVDSQPYAVMAHMTDMLRARRLEDGRSLLMHAAAAGKKAWFLALVDDTKRKLGVTLLARQLRQLDANRAPLLFHAASSNSVRCLKAVRRVLEAETGIGGLREQVYAVDRRGRTIGMYAARGSQAKVFRHVQSLLDGKQEQLNGNLPAERAARLRYRDKASMGILHHAAANGYPEVLAEVIEMANRNGVGDHDFYRADNEGLTPVMHVLRPDSRENYGLSRAAALEEKLTMLLAQYSTPHEKWEVLISPSDSTSTALMHAARGGLESFKVAVNVIHGLMPDAAAPTNGGMDSTGSGPTNGGTGSTGPAEFTLDCRFIDRALGVRGFLTGLRGSLVEEAAKSGDLKVLQMVVQGLCDVPTGYTPPLALGANGNQYAGFRVLVEALKVVENHGQSWLNHAINSGNKIMVEWVVESIKEYNEGDAEKCWKQICARDSQKSSLTCAASMPETAENSGREMFSVVLSALTEAAWDVAWKRHTDVGATADRESLVENFVVEQLLAEDRSGQSKRTPLAGAVKSGNPIMFWKVYDEVKIRRPWDHLMILEQLQHETTLADPRNKGPQDQAETRCVPDVPARMWGRIIQAFQQADEGQGIDTMPTWRKYFNRTLWMLAERGDFERLRALVKSRLSVQDHISLLLEHIGDQEDNVIDIIMLAATYSTNPFVMCAVASKDVRHAERVQPMSRRGLRKLQLSIDAFTDKMLDNLPGTVRGVGMQLLGSHAPVDLKVHDNPAKRDRLANLLGFVVVRWILEPSQASEFVMQGHREMDIVDPLQLALDRGSSGLAFVNAPLVLDYIHLKFLRTLPDWASRTPLHSTINEGLYSSVRQQGGHPFSQKLLRFQQGVSMDDAELVSPERTPRVFPHTTLLPGLQFSLAGIVGKPDTFYSVPAIRFAYEVLSYIAMLGVFVASVFLEDSGRIPIQERIFYVFIAGFMWREILEFRNGLRKRPKSTRRGNSGGDSSASTPGCFSRMFEEDLKKRHRIASAIIKYLFYDTWNILDTVTIIIVAIAFICRLMAVRQGEDWSLGSDGTGEGSEDAPWFFAAQVLLAMAAPFLFARLLFLSQIDDTLGPMAQIIWTMLSHLARFSVFLVVIMGSYALAFYSLYVTCDSANAPSLAGAFGTFWASVLFLFSAMLGNFEYDIFDGAEDCNRPSWAYDASVWMLVTYELIMAILLLNLLIAVLSTVHAKVDENAEQEFQLTRAKLVTNVGRSVAESRLPPPLNLLKAGLGVVIDSGHSIWQLLVFLGVLNAEDYARKDGTADDVKAPPPPAEMFSLSTILWACRRLAFSLRRPASMSFNWHTIEETGNRLLFSLTMGIASLVMLVGLWIISVPWISWRIVRWVFPPSPEDVWKGYTSTALSTVLKLVGWVLTTATIGVAFCIVSAIAACTLWVCGIFGIFGWLRWMWKEGRRQYKDNDRLFMLPGEDRGPDWTYARKVAQERNYFCLVRQFSGHFNVSPLVKMTSGYDPKDLWAQIKMEDETEQTQHDEKPQRESRSNGSTDVNLRQREEEDGWRDHLQDTRSATILVEKLAPEAHKTRVYTSDEHGFRLTVPKNSVRESTGSVLGPIILEHTSRTIRCGPRAFLVTSVVHFFPLKAAFKETSPVALDFAAEPSAELGVYEVLVREEDHLSWRVLPVGVVTAMKSTTDQILFRAHATHFFQFALGKLVNRPAPNPLRLPIDVSALRPRFADDDDTDWSDRSEVAIYNAVETGTLLTVVAVTSLGVCEWPTEQGRRAGVPHFLCGKEIASAQTAHVPPGGSAKLASGTGSIEQVTVIIATVDAHEVTVWGAEQLEGGQRMAILNPFFDGGTPLLGPEALDGRKAIAKQVMQMYSHAARSVPPVRAAGMAPLA